MPVRSALEGAAATAFDGVAASVVFHKVVVGTRLAVRYAATRDASLTSSAPARTSASPSPPPAAASSWSPPRSPAPLAAP
jgi:hypothetical protein